jgi:hypothetical protein
VPISSKSIPFTERSIVKKVLFNSVVVSHVSFTCSYVRPSWTNLVKNLDTINMVEVTKEIKEYLKFRRKLFILNYVKEVGNTT